MSKPDMTWDLRQIIDWVEEHERQEDLDEVVLDIATRQASNVNNKRASKQMEWIVSQIGPEQAKRAILEALED